MKLPVDSVKYSKVVTRVKSWLNPKSFTAKRLRGLLTGITITTTLGEVCGYKLMQQDIRAGHLPAYTTDVAIILFAFFEALVAPFISWWGFRNRRTLLIAYSTAATLCVVPWFFMPGYEKREESQFCNASNSSVASLGVPPRTAMRLVLIIASCVTFSMTRVACWSHGIAYSDEYAPERTSVHYGVLLLARTVPIILGYRLLTGGVDKNMTMQCVGLLVGFGSNVVQLFFIVPRTAPIVKGVQKTALLDERRNFLTSVGRVCSAPLVNLQIFAMGLLAAALFGYVYNEIDVVKVKFNLVPEGNVTVNFEELLQYFFLMFIIAFAGNLFSKPILKEFRAADAMRQIIKTTIFAILAYVVMTILVRCDQGYVAGLSNDLYGNPECSLSCGCKPRLREFEPVCVVDDMVTYVSPCQAGCGGEEFLHGIRAYTNCTCSGSGRAVVGACSDILCKQARRLHSMLLIVAVTFTLLSLQAQGVLLLRTVDPRDKSVVLGMAWSIVTLMTFVCGHMLFIGIREGACSWFEADRCHLQAQNYPYYVGGTSVFLAVTSLLISVISAFYIRKANKNERENTRL
ncbi:solute carrier organic anion transporter family member 2B1-like [Pararge aegeria]|uniref:solute carrier organic anion transporter family member 2B1-like n=1 Tax=Pararge aegeria TaxID=116150 RepID=UPI0019CF6F29|nr:solute carrier organic anion transporter family member 2B1-like [Pararge aegeria]